MGEKEGEGENGEFVLHFFTSRSTRLLLLPRLQRLHSLVNGCDTAGEILPALPANNEASVDDHVAELLLAGEALNALDEILVAVAVAGDELTDERDGAEAPALVGGVEQGVPDLAELEDGEDAAGLEDAVGLAQGGGDVAEVADAEGDGVEVDAGRGDAGGGEVLGVGLEEGERGLLGGREGGGGALAADGEHVRVDVGDGDADVGVGVDAVRVREVAEGDVAGAAGYVEDVLRGRLGWLGGGGGGGEGGVGAGVEGGYVVVSAERKMVRRLLVKGGGRKKKKSRGILPHAVPAKGHEVVHAVVRLGDAAEHAGHALRLLGLGHRLEAKVRLAVGRASRARRARGVGPRCIACGC